MELAGVAQTHYTSQSAGQDVEVPEPIRALTDALSPVLQREIDILREDFEEGDLNSAEQEQALRATELYLAINPGGTPETADVRQFLGQLSSDLQGQVFASLDPRPLPTNIHTVWLGGELTGNKPNIIQQWKDINPNYEVNLWYDEDALLGNLFRQSLRETLDQETRSDGEIYTEVTRRLQELGGGDQARINYLIENNRDFLLQRFNLPEGATNEQLRSSLESYRDEQRASIIALEERGIRVRNIRTDLLPNSQNAEFINQAEIAFGGHFGSASDIIRVEILRQEGGLYTDVDIAPRQPLGDYRLAPELAQFLPVQVEQNGEIVNAEFRGLNGHGVPVDAGLIISQPNGRLISSLSDTLNQSFQRYNDRQSFVLENYDLRQFASEFTALNPIDNAVVDLAEELVGPGRNIEDFYRRITVPAEVFNRFTAESEISEWEGLPVGQVETFDTLHNGLVAGLDGEFPDDLPTERVATALEALAESELTSTEISARVEPFFEAFNNGELLPDTFVAGVDEALEDLDPTQQERLLSAIGEDNLQQLVDDELLISPEVQDDLTDLLAAIPAGGNTVQLADSLFDGLPASLDRTNFADAFQFLLENRSTAERQSQFNRVFEEIQAGRFASSEVEAFIQASSDYYTSLGTRNSGAQDQQRFRDALGIGNLRALQRTEALSPEFTPHLDNLLEGLSGGDPNPGDVPESDPILPDPETETPNEAPEPADESILEELQQRLRGLQSRSEAQSGVGLDDTEAAIEHATELLEPVNAAYAISQDLENLENRVNEIVDEYSEATGVEHSIDPDSIEVDEEGHISFKSINNETQAAVSHELRTDTFDFRLNNFFQRGNEKLDALDQRLAELRPAPSGEPSITTQAVGHLTTAGGLALSGAILAQSIRQLEDGNTSPEAAVGTALGSYFTLHAAYGGFKTALGPVIARRFGSQVSNFTAAAERQVIRGLTRTGVVAEETVAQGLKFAARGVGKAIGAAAPFVGIAVGVYALTEDTIALTEGILEGDDLKIAQGVIDATSDILSLGLDLIGSAFPPAEVVTAPISIIVNAIRFVLDDAFVFIGQELDALPDNASDEQKAIAVLTGLGEGILDVGKNLSPIGAIIDSVDLDKQHDEQQAQLEILRNPDNAFSEEELNGEPAINFNGGEASYNAGLVTFRLGEDGTSGELTLGEVTSANLEGGDGTLPTDSITQTEQFSHSIHTIVLGTGESHMVTTHKESAYLFWFIPVHSQTLISEWRADPDSHRGTYYGNDQDNTFIGLTSSDVGNDTDAQRVLHDYEYHLFGEGGNDSFLLGASTNYVEGGAGSDQYVLEEVADIQRYNSAGQLYFADQTNNYINNYAEDGETDILVLQEVNRDQVRFRQVGENLVVERVESYRLIASGLDVPERAPILQEIAQVENFYRSIEYRHLQIHTEDGYIFEYLEEDSFSPPQITGRILPEAPQTIIEDETTITFIPGIQNYDAATEFEANAINGFTFIGNGQDSHISGRELDETIIGGEGENILDGRGGNDTLVGGFDNDTLQGGSGDDQLVATGSTPFLGRDYLYGDAGNDVLFTTVQADLYGGDGDDTLIVQAPGEDVTDRRDALLAEADRLTAQAGDLNTALAIGQRLDAETLRNQAALLTPELAATRADNIRLYGGAGNDQYNIQRSVSLVEDNEGANVYVIDTQSGGKIEQLVSRNDDGLDDLIIVDLNRDQISGTHSFTDSLILRHQDTDELIAHVILAGDEGEFEPVQVQTADGYTLEFTAQTRPVEVQPGLTIYIVEGFSRQTVGFTIPELSSNPLSAPDVDASTDPALAQLNSISGDDRNNILTGNDSSNYISGGNGANQLNGGAGNDILVSNNDSVVVASPVSTGSDTLTGGLGSDIYRVNGQPVIINNEAADLATDTVVINASVTEITTRLSSTGDLEIRVGNDLVAQVIGWNQGDIYQHLQIRDQDNYILSLDSQGNATLTGRDFSGETENQTYDAQTDTTQPSVTQITGGFGDDSLQGNSLDNIILGSLGNDRLRGRGGNDILLDNAGENNLRGDGGNDTYILNPGTAINTIDLRSPDTAIDIARLQGVTFAEVEITKDGDNLRVSNGQTGDVGLSVIVRDWFAADAPTHLQFVTEDGIRFQVTTDAVPLLEVVEVSFARQEIGVDAFISGNLFLESGNGLPHVTNTNNPQVRIVDELRVIDSPHDDELRGSHTNNTFILTSGNDRVEGRGGQDIYIINDTDDLENPQRDIPLIDNFDFGEGEDDTLFTPNLNAEELVLERSSNVFYPNDLLVGRYNSNQELVPLARIRNWFIGEQYQHLKFHTRDGVFTINSDGTLRRDSVDLSGTTTGQTYDSREDTHGGQVLSLTGSNFDDTLRGDAQTNVFDGRAGRDVYEGRNGQDIYILGATAPGQDVKIINNSASDRQQDTIEIGVARDELALAQVGQDLYLVSANAAQPTGENAAEWEAIAYGVVQQFFVGADHQHLNLRTGDGGHYALQVNGSSEQVNLIPLELQTTAGESLDLRDFPDTTTATDRPNNAENDVIIGNSLDNTLTSNGGNDRLRGRAGQDTYILRRTDGDELREVTIDNRASDLASDLLYIETDGVNLSNPVRDGDDLILSDGDAFAEIRITDWFQDDTARHLQVATQDNYVFSLEDRDGEGYLVLERVDFSDLTRGQRFDASVNPGDRIDYTHAEIRGTQYSDELVGGSGNNTIIPNGGYDLVTGGEGYDFYQVDLTAPNTDEYSPHSIGINNFAEDGLLDTVYLANVNYEEILPGVVFGDLYLAQVSDPNERASLNNTLPSFFVSPFLDGSSPPDTVSISRWSEGESYRHVQFVTADGVTFTVEATGGDGNAVTRDDFILTGLDRRDATSAQAIDLTQAPYQRVESFRGAADQSNTITGNELANNLVGGAQADTIRSGAGDDHVLAGGGNDTLYGDGGNDNLNGGEGDDRFYLDADHNTVIGGGGIDTVDYSSLSSDIHIDVDLQLGVTLKTNGNVDPLLRFQTDLLSHIENVVASNQDSILRGSETDNILTGGSGRDRLTGHGGNDTLTGGGGADAFFFTEDSAGVDTITDFEVGTDTFDISALNLGTSDLNALLATAEQTGNDVLLTLTNDHQVHIQGIQVASLTVSNFTL